MKPPRRLVWQFGYIPDESSLLLSPLPPLCILLSQWQRILQRAALEKESGRAMSRYGLGLIVVTVFVVAAAATHSGLSSNMAVASAKSAVPEFSDEERGRIFDGVMRISDAQVTEMAAPEVADSLPEEFQMRELPTDIIHEIPLVRGHSFVKFDDRILVVSSASRLVVAMIPRYKLLP